MNFEKVGKILDVVEDVAGIASAIIHPNKTPSGEANGAEVAGVDLKELISEFKDWLTSTSEYKILLNNYGSDLFNRDAGGFCILAVRLAFNLWLKHHNEKAQG